MANMAYSAVHKSRNKVLTRKTYWKSVALPSLLASISCVLDKSGSGNNAEDIKWCMESCDWCHDMPQL